MMSPQDDSSFGLLARLLDDQSRRWQKGQRPLVETYVAANPALSTDGERLLDLIYNEVVQRGRLGEMPQLEEYLVRFPSLSDQIRIQFEVHQGVETSLAPMNQGVLGRYVLLEVLGRGGMGEVYKARHTLLDRIDALKLIRADLLMDRSVLARFHQEARAAAKLSHPHIVSVYDAGEADGRHYLALEFVEGVDLAQLLVKRKRLPSHTVCVILYQVAQALHHAQEKGLIHRDVKPSKLDW